MPKPSAVSTEVVTRAPRRTLAQIIPPDAKPVAIQGQDFVKFKESTKANGLHPIVIEMGAQMLRNVGGFGQCYPLQAQTDRLNKDILIKLFRSQLAKYARANAPTRSLKTHVVADSLQPRIVCWYTERGDSPDA